MVKFICWNIVIIPRSLVFFIVVNSFLFFVFVTFIIIYIIHIVMTIVTGGVTELVCWNNQWRSRLVVLSVGTLGIDGVVLFSLFICWCCSC